MILASNDQVALSVTRYDFGAMLDDPAFMTAAGQILDFQQGLLRWRQRTLQRVEQINAELAAQTG